MHQVEQAEHSSSSLSLSLNPRIHIADTPILREQNLAVGLFIPFRHVNPLLNIVGTDYF